MAHRQGRIRAGLIGGALAAVAAPAAAAPADQAVLFDLPPDTLSRALDRFAGQAGVQILYPQDAAQGRRSPRVRGVMPVRAALERLIAGSPLQIARSDARTITLRVAPPTRRAAMRSPARPSPAPVAPDEVETPDPIIVTGRASPTAMGPLDASYAITVIDDAERARRAPQSVAELLRLVPGFWVEATGGEAANNVRARGIPTDGYSSIALLEDGLPVQYDGALGYLNTDQSLRVDETVRRVEAVRGGPSAVFAPNAPGGTINFILRNGIDDPGIRLRASTADYGYGRLDGYWGATIAPGWGLSVGGFLRRSEGIRDPGFTADRGGQVRARIEHRDGENRFTLDLRHLDDRVAFYLPVPLRRTADGALAAVPGFDPLRDTLSGPDNVGVPIRTAGGTRRFDLDTGTRTRLTALTGYARIALGDGLRLETRAALRTSDTTRNALFPTGRPVPGSDYLAGVRATLGAAYPATRAVTLRYATSGQPVPADTLVVGANLMSVHLPLDEWIFDTRLSGQVDLAGTHDLVAGLTLADYDFRFDRYTGTALIEAAPRGRRLDVVALGEGAQVVGRLTDQGIVRHGSIFDQAALGARALALYLADEWQMAPALRLDVGVRAEHSRIRGTAAGKALFDLGDPAALADDQVVGPSGEVIAVDRRFSDWGWSAGLHYRLGARTAAFARWTNSFRLPSAGEFSGNPRRGDLRPVPIRMAELGLRRHADGLDVALVGFYTRFERLPFTDFRFDTASNQYVERTAIADTETFGLEAELQWQVRPWLRLGGQATWQDPRYQGFAVTELVEGVPVARDYTGNQLIRVPRLALRAAPELVLGDASLRVEATHFSRRYSDIANREVLPSYTLLGASLAVSPADGMTLTVELSNITNTLGLTEGNPRLGAFESDPGAYLLARPEFGRTLRLSWLARF